MDASDLNGFSKELVSLIQELVQKEVKRLLGHRYEKYYDCTVTAYNADSERADIRIPGTEETMERLLNKTGAPLAPGDRIRIYVSGENLSNAYIGIKF